MTPQEKASELYNEFDMIIYTDQDHYEQVKQCSLRAVDEILNECIDIRESYWQEVKRNLESF